MTDTLNRRQAQNLIDDYCIDPVPEGAVERLMEIDVDSLSDVPSGVEVVEGRYLPQDEIDAIIYDA